MVVFAKKTLIIFSFIIISSCRLPTGTGFYHPNYMNMEVPDGTPEFKAGWHDGCKSGLGTGAYANSIAYRSKNGPTFSPIYQNSADYKNGWGSAYWACWGYVAHLMQEGPDSSHPLE